MKELEECLEALLTEINPIDKIESVNLTSACDRIIGEDIVAQMMIPPYPKSAMDGYAVRAEDTIGADREHPVQLQVVGELFAGDHEQLPCQPGCAVRVMTGSYVPEGYDAVIRQEDTDYGEEQVQVCRSITTGTNYCCVGEDIRKGDQILTQGTHLTALHIGLLASLGIYRVPVYKRIRCSILSTGSELMAPGLPLLPGKIYNSIAYMLQASMEKQGIQVPYMEICGDEKEELKKQLQKALELADVVITTGGVSVGKKDLLPEVLEELGAKKIFSRANIQPGTPTIGSVLDGKVILSLSGNPYAAYANFEYYFWELSSYVSQDESLRVRTENAVLSSPYPKVNKLRRFVRAYAEEGRVTLPTAVHASSVLSNMRDCNCFIDIEPGRELRQGDEVRIRYFK